MNVIIPVAGEGTRLRPHTHILPKSLLYVAGKPILGHILDSFKRVPVITFVIVVGDKGESIVQFCKTYRYNFKFVFQKKRLGLGHAVYMGAKGLKGKTIVLLGDTIIDWNFKKFNNKQINILAVKAVDDPRRFGIVEVKGNDVLNLVEKPKFPKSNLAIVGLYYFQHIEKVYRAVRSIMNKKIRTKGEYQLTDALKYLMDKGERFKAVRIDKWYDCGTAAALIETNRHLLRKNHHFTRRKKTIIQGPVYIADSAKIVNSIIGPHVSIGENTIIDNSIIKDSIINSEATVKNAALSESIIGEKAIVRGGHKKLNVGTSSVVEIP
jgi:glucose-1-phosphate thymidylyltransferase